MSLVIAPCSHEAAKYAVEHWHYSKSLPTPPVVKYGVWEDERFIGAVLFSRGASPDLHKPYHLKATELCELTRVALANHESTVSQIVSRAVARLRRDSPGLRLIVSFADPNEGHHGGIYQALNWLYSGDTAPSEKFRDCAGRVWHGRQVSVTGFKKQYGQYRRVARTTDCERLPQLGKHRYLYPLDRAMRRQIAPLAKPYPRAAEVSM